MNINNEQTLSFCISSPSDRESLVAELFLGNSQVAELRREGNEFFLEIYPNSNGLPWDINLSDFLTLIADAKMKLS